MIVLYNFLVVAGLILASPVICPYLLVSPKRRRSFLKRLGFQPVHPAQAAEPDACSAPKPVWIHALSVGELLATLPLIHQLRRQQPGVPIVLSASTVTGYESAQKMFRGEAAQIIYFPHDLQFSVHRMVTRIHPGLVIIMESDVWPNFVSKMKRLGIPVVFANARISDRSFKIYQRFPWLVGLLFSKFAKICAQSEEDARRFRELGIPAGSIAHTGNLKFDQDAEALSAEELSELRRELAAEPNRRVWVAGSTHAGEEALICKAFKEIQASVGRLLLVVAPRDPGRAGEVRQEFIRSGFSVRYLSEAARAQECEEGPDVVVVDCLGRLRRLYAVADIALVGGSLLCIRGIGGHNPLEPAAYSKPVVFGPNMSDFKEITRLLIETGGCIQVETPEDLSRAVVSVLKDAEHAARMGQRAFHVFCANRGAVDKTFRVVQQYLHPCMESPLLSPEG